MVIVRTLPNSVLLNTCKSFIYRPPFIYPCIYRHILSLIGVEAVKGCSLSGATLSTPRPFCFWEYFGGLVRPSWRPVQRGTPLFHLDPWNGSGTVLFRPVAGVLLALLDKPQFVQETDHNILYHLSTIHNILCFGVFAVRQPRSDVRCCECFLCFSLLAHARKVPSIMLVEDGDLCHCLLAVYQLST